MRKRALELVFQEEKPALDETAPLAKIVMQMRDMRSNGKAALENLWRKMDEACLPNLERLRRDWSNEHEVLMRRHRILCLTEKVDNILLWSHYANDHKGVALRFECIEEINSAFCAATKVTYSSEAFSNWTVDQWVDWTFGIIPPPNNDYIDKITRKAQDWAYESEWRIVFTENNPGDSLWHFYSFNPRELTHIYFGCRIDQQLKIDLLGFLVGDFCHVKAYQARQHRTKFGLEFDVIK